MPATNIYYMGTENSYIPNAKWEKKLVIHLIPKR